MCVLFILCYTITTFYLIPIIVSIFCVVKPFNMFSCWFSNIFSDETCYLGLTVLLFIVIECTHVNNFRTIHQSFKVIIRCEVWWWSVIKKCEFCRLKLSMLHNSNWEIAQIAGFHPTNENLVFICRSLRNDIAWSDRCRHYYSSTCYAYIGKKKMENC